MRASRLTPQLVLVLEPEEAEALADACALLICVFWQVGGCGLPESTAQMLRQLFSVLAKPSPQT